VEPGGDKQKKQGMEAEGKNLLTASYEQHAQLTRTQSSDVEQLFISEMLQLYSPQPPQTAPSAATLATQIPMISFFPAVAFIEQNFSCSAQLPHASGAGQACINSMNISSQATQPVPSMIDRQSRISSRSERQSPE
jgi:hypothetical protein